MFKQSKLAAAVLAAVATTGVQAVNLANEETGQVLIFPYYNTNNGFVTQISLTNTTDLFKAVKVRFRESKESNDTLDFNIYMSPFDSWTGIVRENPNNGKANIITTDESCTYPSKALLQAGVDFIDLYTAVDAEDTSEGYFEVIEMGVVADGGGPADDGGDIAEIQVDGTEAGNPAEGNDDRSIPAGLEHDSDGMPEDCSVVNDGWVAGDNNEFGFTKGDLVGGLASDAVPNSPYDGDGLNDGLVAPTGGLTGYTIFLQASTGAAYVADATVLDNYASVPQHYRSDDPDDYLLPSLASGDNVFAQIPTIDGSTTPVDWTAGVFPVDPGLLDDIAPNAPKRSGQNPMPIAHVLNVTGVSNDYFVAPGTVDGATDWVVTFPMKKHGIFNSEVISDDIANFCDTDGDGTGDEPASGYFSCPYGSVVDAGVEGSIGDFFDTVDVEFALEYWDREEAFFIQEPDAPGFSPVIDPEAPTLTLDREVNVLTWSESGGTTNSVLGTPADNVFSVVLQPGFEGGWARISFDSRYNLGNVDTPFYDVSGVAAAGAPGSFGVPAIGFSAIRGTVGPAGASGETIPHVRYRFQPTP